MPGGRLVAFLLTRSTPFWQPSDVDLAGQSTSWPTNRSISSPSPFSPTICRCQLSGAWKYLNAWYTVARGHGAGERRRGDTSILFRLRLRLHLPSLDARLLRCSEMKSRRKSSSGSKNTLYYWCCRRFFHTLQNQALLPSIELLSFAMEEFSEDVTVKAELRCLRLEVQNMQLQMQCVHQGMPWTSSPWKLLTHALSLQSSTLLHYRQCMVK